MVHIGEGIKYLQNIKYLHLGVSDNEVGDEGVEVLCGELRQLKHIVELFLVMFENKTGEKGNQEFI